MKVKGSAINATIIYIKEKFGEDGLAKVKSSLERDEDRELIDKQIFLSSWYSFETFLNLTRAMDETLGTGDFSIARASGEFSAEHDLKTIYKLFFKLGSPQFIINRASQVFSTYYDSGKFSATKSDKGLAILLLQDFPYLEEIFLQRVAGWMEKTLEMSGGHSPRVLITRIQIDGKAAVEFKATWT